MKLTTAGQAGSRNNGPALIQIRPLGTLPCWPESLQRLWTFEFDCVVSTCLSIAEYQKIWTGLVRHRRRLVSRSVDCLDKRAVARFWAPLA
jgi:hypothetical protein